MKDGHLNKCKKCAIFDGKLENGIHKKICLICKNLFRTTGGEISRGGGKVCSRKCFYERLRKIIKREKQSPNWKGNLVGHPALHDWVKRNLGKPSKCEHCKTTEAKKFEWANKSRKYKRDLNDWIRLCSKCHQLYDNSLVKRKKTLTKKYGWQFKENNKIWLT